MSSYTVDLSHSFEMAWWICLKRSLHYGRDKEGPIVGTRGDMKSVQGRGRLNLLTNSNNISVKKIIKP